MKEFYTIGETAALLGVTTQTLRYYDKIGLLSPHHTDPVSHYRYYCYHQFHLIDRIRYLEGFGLSLEEIRQIIRSGKVDQLLNYLREQRQETIRELRNLQDRVKDIDWYLDYFSYMGTQKAGENLYRIQQPERYIIKCPCYYREPLPDMEIRLAKVKSRPEYAHVKFHRQYGYSLDIESLFHREFYPREYFIFLNQKPQELAPSQYDVLPEGEYLCIRTQLLHEDWDPEPLTAYFSNKERPKLTLAMEFEDNLVDWSDAWYELQALL
jgi:DNA-binding transcriptional MerR regulator